jgi:hypothetical protein
MLLSIANVTALAPDAAAAAAGKKLADPRHWTALGHDERAYWGECKGSALYQTRVDTSDFASKCSCPSRKFPCKHALGLLMLAAAEPAIVPGATAPAWVAEWIEKRETTRATKATKDAAPGVAPAPPDAAKREAAKTQRAAKREANVKEGLERLDLWLADLARQGLAGIESRPPGFFEAAAARLVDAQCPGLATRVRRLTAISLSGGDWPEKLLGAIGSLKLLVDAYGRETSLPELSADLRQLVGWTVSEDELAAHGDRVRDTWQVAGQWTEEEERIRMCGSWLFGTSTGREALVLSFAAGTTGRTDGLVPGTEMDAELLFYPSAHPQRARVGERFGEISTFGAFAAPRSIGRLLDDSAGAWARQPWLDRFGAVLDRVRPATDAAGRLHVVDGDGAALRLRHGDHRLLCALSGGEPVDVAGDWNGAEWRPLGVLAAGRFFALGGRA